MTKRNWFDKSGRKRGKVGNYHIEEDRGDRSSCFLRFGEDLWEKPKRFRSNSVVAAAVPRMTLERSLASSMVFFIEILI
jgi:hypothetical protein